ncbi:ABC transporter ATP-binding protein [Olegusella massiliensis]|uniref:ABC transporter ATP-binding protein n=1 Tax=Olegusella massiliensis TaxID=1776381 RepID=UPI000A68463B|nr:ABC transporter ATP-binding protein [Olegusella massiliensis]
MALLSVRDMHVYYGSIHAIKGISFDVEEGEVVTLIGANGAGKSTTLKTVSGLMVPRAGEIEFAGESIASVPANDLVPKGLALCPEGRSLFQAMSVEENLEMGGYTRPKNEVADDMERVFALFPRLKERRRQIAGTLSGGEQQMVAMGRAMMSRPRLLMLDEPSMGLAPILVQEIFNIIRRLHDEGTTVLLVEQNAQMALSVADRAYVLETGHIAMDGPASELAADDRVRKAYLGG